MKKIPFLFLIVVLIVSLAAVPAQASSGSSSSTATIKVTASDSTVLPGEGTVVYTFSITSTNGLGSVMFHVNLPEGITQRSFEIAPEAQNSLVTDGVGPSYSAGAGFKGAALPTIKGDVSLPLMTLTCDVSKDATVGVQLSLSLAGIEVNGGDTYVVAGPGTDLEGAKVTVSHGEKDSDYHDWNAGTVTNATCTKAKTTTYTCQNSSCGEKREVTEGGPLGHKWGEPVITWGADHEVATATVQCQNTPCEYHDIPFDAVANSAVTVDVEETSATCQKAGSKVSTATITVPDGKGGTTSLTSSEKDTEEIAKLKHNWSVEWKWSSDYSSADAVFTCSVGNHTQTEHADVTHASENATCTKAGTVTHTATVNFDQNDDNTKEAITDTKATTDQALGHDWDTPVWNWTTNAKKPEEVSATVTLKCKRSTCDDSEYKAGKTLDVTSIEKAITPATCETAGEAVYTGKITAPVDPKTEFTATKELTLPALGHTWSTKPEDVTVVWNTEKEPYTVTSATRTCVTDPKHTQQANAVQAGGVTSKVTKNPTYEEEGETTYTAELTFPADDLNVEWTCDVTATAPIKKLEPEVTASVQNNAANVIPDIDDTGLQGVLDAEVKSVLSGGSSTLPKDIVDAIEEAGATSGTLNVSAKLVVDDGTATPNVAPSAVQKVYDIYIEVTVTGSSGVIANSRIADTGSEISFTVPKTGNGPIWYVMTDHGGTWGKIDSKVDGDNIVFSSSQFSNFAIISSNSLKDAKVTGVDPSYTYTGSEIKPAVKVTINGGEELKEGEDYVVEYSNNTNVGTATVTIKPAEGSDFTDEVTLTFKIVEKPAASGSGSGSGASPATGDETPIALYAGLLALSAGALALVLTRKRKTH